MAKKKQENLLFLCSMDEDLVFNGIFLPTLLTGNKLATADVSSAFSAEACAG